MRDKWTRKVVQKRETEQKELMFSDFIELVRVESEVLTDPVYSIQLEAGDRNKGEHDEGKKRFGG